MSGVPKKTYSDVYEKLVLSDRDLEGAVAYAFYKADKRQYIIDNNLTWDDPKIKDYNIGTQMMSGLRQKANTALSAHTASAVSAAAQGAQIPVLKKLDSLDALIKSRTNFGVAVGAGIIAGFLLSLLLSIAIFLNKHEQNSLGGIYKLLNEGTSSEKPASAPN